MSNATHVVVVMDGGGNSNQKEESVAELKTQKLSQSDGHRVKSAEDLNSLQTSNASDTVSEAGHPLAIASASSTVSLHQEPRGREPTLTPPASTRSSTPQSDSPPVCPVLSFFEFIDT